MFYAFNDLYQQKEATMRICKRENSNLILFKARIILLLIFALLIFMGSLQSQTNKSESNQETLQHEVTVTLKLIQVYVTDKKGNPITDLTKSDFVLHDNGKLEKITDFEIHVLFLPGKKTEEIQSVAPSEIPSRMNRKFFLFFDLAFNTQAGITKSKRAGLHFIDTKLHPTDNVGILSYSATKGLILHEYLTTNHQKLRQVIAEFGLEKMMGKAQDAEGKHWLEQATAAGKTGSGGGKGGKGGLAGGEFSRLPLQSRQFDRKVYSHQASNFFSVVQDVAKTFRNIPGVKHFILFSGGVSEFAVNATSPYESMTKELAASNSPVYAVKSSGLSDLFKSKSLQGDYSLRKLSAISGGKYYHNIDNYEKIMEDIQNATSSYYVLGYYINEKWDGKFHKTDIKVKRKGCKIYGQTGYFNPKPFTEYTEFEKLMHLMDLALSETPQYQEVFHFPLIVLPYSIQKKSNLVILSKIPREKIKDISRGNMEIITLIFDKKNNILEFQNNKVSASTFTRDNVYFCTTSSLLPGDYDCRVVIRNLETGKGAIASSPIVISEAPESGLKLHPPLLLIPEKNAFYLIGSAKEKREKTIFLSDIYPFDSSQYAPIVKNINKGIPKIRAAVRCSIFNIQQPEIELSAQLIHTSSDKKTPLSFSILEQSQENDTRIFLVEFPITELQPGKYSLQLFAQEMKTKLSSYFNAAFIIR